MAQATLTITLPEQVWIQQVSTAYPEATFRVLAAVPGNESGFALVRLAGSAVPEMIDEIEAHPQVLEITVVQRSEREATIHFETTAPLLLFSSQESGIPIELPVEIRGGEATIEVTGSRERLAELAEQLEQFGLQYRIERVQERLHQSQLLSERQLEVVAAAVDEGYYDTPRRCSLTELAGHLGIAKSTCSETLHRAEEAIVKHFVEDLPALHDDDDEMIERPLAGD
ncbi:helix-turn-helix domain-containing protein [Natronococcus roseus]|uniref:helix-turn-helix domain-containing protein n=1 Tax=Natronococcus roseus TaxID=1052014 RepID=UPI00374D0D38